MQIKMQVQVKYKRNLDQNQKQIVLVNIAKYTQLGDNKQNLTWHNLRLKKVGEILWEM